MRIKPTHAMVLAAGFGTRMRAGPNDPPKPLVKVGGKTLLGRMLDRLRDAGVTTMIVNVHHLAEQIEGFLSAWGEDKPDVTIHISDERDHILETGGGVKKALPLLGDYPFYICNADILWHEQQPNLVHLASEFEGAKMDACLLLAPRETAMGYDGLGDYACAPNGLLSRVDGPAPYIFAGVQIATKAAIAKLPEGPVSLTHMFNDAITYGRLYGCALQGKWMHVGTPEGRAAAESYLSKV